ncbi:MAG: hypothetical protein QW724_04795 [Nitrososphaerota archaeon]
MSLENIENGRIRMINDMIDLASLTTNLTGVYVEINDDLIKLTRKWKVRGRECRREISIKRFVNAESFARMLGLYRAEGLKKPKRVRFTNKDPALHQWFIEPLRQMGVNREVAYVYYRGQRGEAKLNRKVKQFEKMTGIKIKAVYRHPHARNPMFVSDVNSTPLAAFIIHSERILRKRIAYEDVPRNIAMAYLRGLLEGDGSINIKIKGGRVSGMHLSIYETDIDPVHDILVIFEKYFSLRLAVYSEKCVPNGRQMKSINLDDILELTSENIVPSRHLDEVMERIALAFRKKGTPWILLKLAGSFEDRQFSSSEVSKILSKPRHHVLEKLKTLERRGYLVSVKKKLKAHNEAGTPVRRFFKLTGKAIKIVKSLSSLLPSFILYCLNNVLRIRILFIGKIFY